MANWSKDVADAMTPSEANTPTGSRDVVSLAHYRDVLVEKVRLEHELEQCRRDFAALREACSPEAVEKLKTLVLNIKAKLVGWNSARNPSVAMHEARELIEAHTHEETKS